MKRSAPRKVNNWILFAHSVDFISIAHESDVANAAVNKPKDFTYFCLIVSETETEKMNDNNNEQSEIAPHQHSVVL